VQLFYQIALQGRRDLPLSPDPRSGFEMLLLRMMSFKPLREGMQLSTITEKTTTAESSTRAETTKKKTVAPEQVAVKVAPESSKLNKPIIQPVVAKESPPWEVLPEELDVSKTIPKIPLDKKNVTVKPEAVQTPIAKSSKNEKWHDIIPQLSLTGQSAELIKHSLLASKENGMISLTLEVSNRGLIADAIKAEMQTALSQYYGESLNLSFTIDKIETKENSATINETFSKRSEREEIEALQQAEQNIETDPFVIELKNRFGAQVVPGSVYPK
jgi:DNA polymerase-3 subunit gamma/tau